MLRADPPAAPVPALTPSGIAVEVRAEAVAPTLELPGEVRSTKTGTVISHYGYWVQVQWMAPEGSHITKGQTAARVLSENMADRAAGAVYWLEETVAAESEEEASVALNAAQRDLTVRQAEWDLEEAKLEVAVLQAGPDAADLGGAELAVKRASLELQAADAAVGRLGRLGTSAAAASQEKLTEAQHARDLARIHLSRAQNALTELKQGPEPTALADAQAKVDHARAALETARAVADAGKQKDSADLAAARAQVASVSAIESELTGSMKAMTRVAPASGTVVWARSDRGGKSRPGLASLWAQPIVTIVDPSQAAFVARATEEQVSRLRVGMAAGVRVSGVAAGPLAGKVAAIAATSEDLSQWYEYSMTELPPDTGVRVYDVLISLDGPKGLDLYQGMAGRAEVRVGERATRTLVPRACVKSVRGTDWALVESGGRWAPRPVVTGAAEGPFLTVEEGLQPGDRVALLAQ